MRFHGNKRFGCDGRERKDGEYICKTEKIYFDWLPKTLDYCEPKFSIDEKKILKFGAGNFVKILFFEFFFWAPNMEPNITISCFRNIQYRFN